MLLSLRFSRKKVVGDKRSFNLINCSFVFITLIERVFLLILLRRMWWTITGNFGNILPIDWSKSYARQMHVPALKLGERPAETPDDEIQDLSSEDEAVANDLDLHQLILSGMQQNDNGPIQTAEEVIKEIDDIMDEQTPSEGDALEQNEVMEKAKEVLGAPLYEDSEY